MSLAVGGLFIHQYNSAEFETRNYGLLGLFALILFGAFYTLKIYINNAPSITATNNFIVFNNSKHFWTDLEQIEMTGKRPFKFMGEQKEGVLLKFKGQDEQYIFDDMYENAPQIKSFIQNLAIDNNPINQIPLKETTSENPIDENIIYYKGSQFLCIEGIGLWLFVLLPLCLSVYNLINSSSPLQWMTVILFELFLSIIFSRRMYYFGLSGSQLIIRNHNFFWSKKICYLSDIKEIVFEQRYKMPVTLRVIYNDFTSQTYSAATIWSKNG